MNLKSLEGFSGVSLNLQRICFFVGEVFWGGAS